MHLLVIRFSAMGDVALVRPALQALLNKYPALEITVVSKPAFAPFFENEPRLHFFAADVIKNYTGARGLWRLAGELHLLKFDAVVDLHSVLRSRVLCMMFRTMGDRIIRFKKGRKEKLTLIKTGKLKKLPHSTERYLKAFEPLGFTAKIEAPHCLKPTASEAAQTFYQTIKKENATIVGIAPFAMHASKEWGLGRVKETMQGLQSKQKVAFVLFGGGDNEVQKLNILATEVDQTHNAAGKFSLRDELWLMQQLNAMLTMDSANMHMATLVGTPVVSVWGPTHHYLGFGPLGNENNIVEAPKDAVPCRPCTVFGKVKTQAQRNCAQKAMAWITPEMVVQKISGLLLLK